MNAFTKGSTFRLILVLFAFFNGRSYTLIFRVFTYRHRDHCYLVDYHYSSNLDRLWVFEATG